MFLSANAFMHKRNYLGFARKPGDSDLDHARNLAYEFLLYFENYRFCRARADCHRILYADLVREPAALAARLGGLLGIELAGGATAAFEFHQTSADPEQSIERWRREPIREPVVALFAAQLHEASATALGFDLLPPPTPCMQAAEFPDLQARITGLACSADGMLTPAGEDGVRIALAGEECWLMAPVEPFDAAPVRELWVSVCGQAGNHASLVLAFVRTRTFPRSRHQHVPFHPGVHFGKCFASR